MGIHGGQRVHFGTKVRTRGSDADLRSLDVLDANLSQIFASLAQLLVSSGYGFARVGELAKLAFVDAARSLDFESGTKVSIARIAALTGLTRTEVSKLLRRNGSLATPVEEPPNRALRVAQGWIADSRFLNPNNSPRTLKFDGKHSSFSKLVKKYSGDIPARAMLSEMKRLGIVRHSADDSVTLVRTKLGISRRTMLAVKAISPWIGLLAEKRDNKNRGEINSSTNQVKLSFNSIPQLLNAVRELDHRRIALVEGLGQLGEAELTDRKHILNITIAVAAEVLPPKSKRR